MASSLWPSAGPARRGSRPSHPPMVRAGTAGSAWRGAAHPWVEISGAAARENRWCGGRHCRGRESVSDQLVLWDIDGTLLNADEVGRDLYDVVFLQLFGRSIEAFAPMAGRTDRAIILETLTMAGVSEPRRYVDPFIAGLTAQAPSVRSMVAARGR